MPILHWLTRDEDLRAAQRVPYRLLEEVPALSAGDRDSGNMLIQGDNLEVLKALLPFYAGRVKCIYIDPPYNTRSAFEHYDDNREHAQWLGMMWPRLELLRDLLAEDGSIWVSIDDNEGHYLKVIMDEVFGRGNFIATVIWKKIHARNNTAKHFSDDHDFTLVYAKTSESFSRNKISRTDASDAEFWNPDNDVRGPWRRSDMTASKPYAEGKYEVVGPHGEVFTPRENRYWGLSKDSFDQLLKDNRIWWGKKGRTFPFRKRFKDELGALVPTTIWNNTEVGDNREAKQETTKIFGRELIFGTPKPERLARRIVEISSKPGDLVLDSFLGSGTVAAVAQKMGRRFIGIEMGEHAVSHCVSRLTKVIDGEQGGISRSVGWQGGGGFRFYRLGPPVFDEEGRIRGDIRFRELAAHVWFSETDRPWDGGGTSPLLGLHDGRAYALLYNGILGDKRPGAGNVLTRATLALIRAEIARRHPELAAAMADYPLTVYGEQSRLTPATLLRERIAFKQTPYDVKARR